MAGGIDWFRWHHGSVIDPKFQLIAKKSNARFGDVIAVWAFILESASTASERGDFGPIDCESIDFMLSAEDGTAQRIIDAMTARGLLEGSRVCSWEKRQPKREDDTAAERKRRQRERQSATTPEPGVTADTSHNVTPCHDDVTQSHADVTQSHDRGEESRGDIDKEPNGSVASTLPTCPHDAVIALYHRILPELPEVRLVSDQRKKSTLAFWKWVLSSKKSDGTPRATNATEALSWISSYFERARDNDFLMGRCDLVGRHANWRADFDFLLTEKGKRHVIEKTGA